MMMMRFQLFLLVHCFPACLLVGTLNSVSDFAAAAAAVEMLSIDLDVAN